MLMFSTLHKAWGSLLTETQSLSNAHLLNSEALYKIASTQIKALVARKEETRKRNLALAHTFLKERNRVYAIEKEGTI